MSNVIRRNQQEWLALITECRRSGLSDAEWCRQNGISRHTFYKAVERLRKKACALPDRPGNIRMDLTREAQDVVQIGIVPDKNIMQTPAIQDTEDSPSVEIMAGGIEIKIHNHISNGLFSEVLRALRGCSC